MKLSLKRFHKGFSLLAIVLALLGLSLAACSSEPAAEEAVEDTAPAEVEQISEVESGWNAPVEFAEDAFPTPLSQIEEHENPWQIRDCFTCHDKQTGGATEIPHDIYTQSCRQCHVPEEGSGNEY